MSAYLPEDHRPTTVSPRRGLRAGFTAWQTRATLLLRSVLHRRRFESEMDEEIRFHLDQRTNELTAQGLSPQEAKRQARLEFGGPESHRDGMRSAFGLRWLDELTADLRYSTRLLRKSPGFTAIAVSSLALAIGANTTIFSVANQLLYERLDVPYAEQLRMAYHVSPKGTGTPFHENWGNFSTSDEGGQQSNVVTYPIFEALQERAPTGTTVFTFKNMGRVNASVDGHALPVEAEMVSGNYYAAMRTVPQLGRGILPSDDGAPGSGFVAVISDGLWREAFGASPSVIGKVIHIDAIPVTVVGVNARGFTGADGVLRSPSIFLPMSLIPALTSFGVENVFRSTKLAWVPVMLRRGPGESDAALQKAMDSVFTATVHATMQIKPGEVVPHLVLEDGSRGTAQSSVSLRRPIHVLLVLVGCVLLLACANIANLLLARVSHRQREMSVRLALGANRMRIFRQSLTESLLLAVMGGAAGAVLAFLGRNTLPRLMQNPWERTNLNVPFNWPVFFFMIAVTMLTGILFGLLPAWQASRGDVSDALKQGSAAATRRRRAWMSKGIVAFQVAMATLLVVGSGLFLRSIWNLSRVPTGFDSSNLLLFELHPPAQTYPGRKSLDLHRAIEERIAALPGVVGVSPVSVPLVAGWMSNTDFTVEGAPPTPKDTTPSHADMDNVGPGFFRIMSIPILAGRALGPQDDVSAPKVAVINRTAAQKYFSGRNPIGLRFNKGDLRKIAGKDVPQLVQVVGVCADTKYDSLKNEVPPLYFQDYRQIVPDDKGAYSTDYVVRSSLPLQELADTLQRTIAAIDPNLPMFDVRTEEQQIAGTVGQERTFASLAAGFGILALLLACVGIYGIMAYTVSQRTNEIGIRLALGAPRLQVRAMVLREAALLTVVGVLVGLAAALGCVRLVKSMLYGLTPHDPVSLTVAPLLLLTVALLASWLPAARASRVEPMIALRHE